MTSRQKMLRQRDQATSFLQAPASDTFYVLVAGPSNIVGNYPRYGITAQSYMLPAVNLVIPEGTLIRDMGKTISAYSLPAGSTGFFRAVQLIRPVAAESATASTTFGVGIGSQGASTQSTAGNTGDFGYGTYYLPIVMNDGAIASVGDIISANLPYPYLPLGGQM